jgi:protein TonB
MAGLMDTAASDRLRAALPAIAVHVLLAFVLLRGLASAPPAAEQPPLKLIALTPEQVPPPLVPPPPPPSVGRAAAREQADPRPQGAASPPNLEARPTPVAAPEPIVPMPLPPPPIRAAPVAGTGFASSAGAAPIRGPGTGSGGLGNGTGSGSGGSGAGGGGGGGGGNGGGGPVGRLSRPRQIAGRISIRDLPEAFRDSGFQGRVGVVYRIEVDGRATDCRVTDPSGSRAIDALTCRLIEQRFRFQPARDEMGRAFAGNMEQDHYWESEAPPPDEAPPRRRRGW